MNLKLFIIFLLAFAILAGSGLSQHRVGAMPDSGVKLESIESVLPDGPQSSSTSASGKVAWQAILSGGSFSASAGFISRDASGQIAIGPATTANYKIYQGFLQSFLLVESCLPGDVNGDEVVDVDDAVYLLNYIFSAGPEPVDLCCADVNKDGQIDVDDVVLILGYSFGGGIAPGRGC